MFEFIPNKLSSQEAFPIIDEFYDGWFTARKLSWNDVLTYFPGADDWDRATLFSGLLWMYYNYPIDFMAGRADKIPGAKLYRRLNFQKVACFLVQSGMNKSVVQSILEKLAESNMKGKYPAVKDIKNIEIDEAMKGEGFSDAEMAVIKESTKYVHPFGRKTKAGRVVVADLKKRNKKGIIFTEKAIEVDNNLISYLNFEFLKLFGRRDDQRIERRVEKASRLKQKMEEEERRNRPRMTIQTLFDQLGLENVSVSLDKDDNIPQYDNEPKLRHNVTAKRFGPFMFEEINLDIDPNVIADKITELTTSGSSSSSVNSKSLSTSKSKRSDFSTESFFGSDRSDNSGTPLNWDDASSIEL